MILLHSSRVFTTSLVTSRHDRQTAAQATTWRRAGQATSLASTLCITSISSSGGRFAHCPCCCGSWPCRCGCVCGSGHRLGQECRDPPRPWPARPSEMPPRLDMLPMPSLISLSSRTMLFKDIATYGQLLSLSRKEAAYCSMARSAITGESTPKMAGDSS